MKKLDKDIVEKAKPSTIHHLRMLQMCHKNPLLIRVVMEDIKNSNV